MKSMRRRLCWIALLAAVLVIGPTQPVPVDAFDDSLCECQGRIDMYYDHAMTQYYGTIYNSNPGFQTSTWGLCQGECGDWAFDWAVEACQTYSPSGVVKIKLDWYWRWWNTGYAWWHYIGPQPYSCDDIT